MFVSRCDERCGSMEKKTRLFEVILKCLDVYFKLRGFQEHRLLMKAFMYKKVMCHPPHVCVALA